MSQLRFSIVLVGVSALLRRPLVSRLRPAGFTARGSGGFRRSGRPSASAFAAGRVALRAHDFRFSVRTASELPSASWPSGLRLPLFGTHRFGVALGGLVLLPSASEFAHGGLAFGFTASTFRHAPLRKLPSAGSFFRWAGWPSGSLLPLFGTPRFGDYSSAGWPSGSRLPLFGMHRFGIALGELAFGLTAFAFRHAPIRTAAPPTRGSTEHTDTTLVSLQNTYLNMLTYHIVRRKHFKTGKLLYYPQLVTPVADDHMHIIERIEKKCTLASADVKAVVDALEVEIIDSLRQGRSVRLGDLGSFRPTLRCSAGVDLSELAGVGQIKRVLFHPSSRIRRALSVKDHAVSFVQRDKKKHGANAQQGGSPTGGATPGAPAPSTGSSAAGSAVTPPGTPVPAPPSTGTPAGTPVPAAPSPTTSTTTGTPAPSTGTPAAGGA